MKTKKFVVFVLTALLILTAAAARCQENSKKEGNTSRRPKVGLVLSGGGAKGFAHIGAIKVIEEAGLPIDYITGTSMGSIVGALYAIGYTPEQMEEIILQQDWNRVMKDEIPREYIHIEEKLDKQPYIATFPLFSDGLQVKTGLREGQLVGLLLKRTMNHVSDIKDYDSLCIPFLCVATDLETGLSYRMRHGNLDRSVRASMSIPLFFTPAEVDNKILVDGGLVENFPVRAALEMGADIIIGIDVQEAFLDKKHLNSSIDIANQITFLMGMEENDRAKKLVDIYIHPDLHGAGAMSFDRNKEIINYGEEKTREYFPQLKHLADSIRSIEDFVPTKHDRIELVDSVFVTKINYPGFEKDNSKKPNCDFDDDVPMYIKISQIEDAVMKIYATGFYTDIWYDWTPDGEGKQLNIHCKRVTDSSISFGLHYDTDYGIGFLASAKLNNLFLKSFNHTLKLNAYVAESPFVDVDFQFAQTHKLRFGLDVKALYTAFDKYDGDRIDYNYSLQDNFATFYTKFYPSYFHQIKLEVKEQYTRFRDKKMNENVDEYNFFTVFSLGYLFDNKDQTEFTSKGVHLNVKGRYIIPNVKKTDGSHLHHSILVQGDFDMDIPVTRKHTFTFGAFGGAKIGDNDLPTHYNFFVGGQSDMFYSDNIISFTGFRFTQMTVDRLACAKVEWKYFFFKKLYLVGRCNAGYLSSDYDKWFYGENFKIGYGLSLGMKTFAGPIEVSIMNSNADSGVFGFFTVGHCF